MTTSHPHTTTPSESSLHSMTKEATIPEQEQTHSTQKEHATASSLMHNSSESETLDPTAQTVSSTSADSSAKIPSTAAETTTSTKQPSQESNNRPAFMSDESLSSASQELFHLKKTQHHHETDQHNQERRYGVEAGLPPLLKMKKSMQISDGKHGKQQERATTRVSANLVPFISQEHLSRLPSTLSQLIIDEHLHQQVDELLSQLENWQHSQSIPSSAEQNTEPNTNPNDSRATPLPLALQSQLIRLLLQMYEKQNQSLLLYLRKDIQLALDQIETSLRELARTNAKVRQLFGSSGLENIRMHAFMLSTQEKDYHFTQRDLEERWESVIRFLEKNPQMIQQIPKLRDPLLHILQQAKTFDVGTELRAASDFAFTIPQHHCKKEKDGKCIVLRCSNLPMMCTNYCFKHILYDPKQELYVPGKNFYDPRLCNEPLIPNKEFRTDFLRPTNEETAYLQMMRDEERSGVVNEAKDRTVPRADRASSLIGSLLGAQSTTQEAQFPSSQQCIMFHLRSQQDTCVPSKHIPENLKKRALDLIGTLEPSSKRTRVE
uniref:KANL2-like probable zinc-finger domain-containing protein n=1 Tax=Percolomonas cosmopolitus TaxID=63605 RepID=A0A7S1KRU9_9EUKA|mmetsp:Transcript_6793/g.25337  ORF Transcript_6793/g.25337 Transcript_6793/m.25337 type:complete len:548 (+) Transcript_6793:2-1645(+)